MNTEELELTKKAVQLLNDRNLKELKELLAEQNPADISNIFEEVPRTDVILLFRLLPKELAADTFAHLDSDEQELIIKGFSDKEIEAIMEDLFIDDAVDLIEEMPASVVKKILKNTDRETRNTINDILKYPKDCAGSIMTTEYVNFRPQQTVEEAFSIIRKTGVDKETIYTCLTILAPLKGSLASAEDLLPPTLNAPAIILPAHLSFRRQSDTLKPTTKHTAPFPNIIKILTIQATPISHFGKCLRFIKNQKNMSFSKKKASHQSYRHTSIVNAFMTWKSET